MNRKLFEDLIFNVFSCVYQLFLLFDYFRYAFCCKFKISNLVPHTIYNSLNLPMHSVIIIFSSQFILFQLFIRNICEYLKQDYSNIKNIT